MTIPRILPVASLCVAIFNCSSSGEIKVQRDSFRKTKTVSLELEHASVEKNSFFSERYSLIVTYVKQENEGQAPTIELKFVAPSTATSELQAQAFIKADKEKFEVKFENIKRSVVTGGAPGNTKSQASRLPVEYVSVAKINLPPEIWKAMIASKRFGYRIYLDQEALSFLVSDKHMLLLKDFDSK